MDGFSGALDEIDKALAPYDDAPPAPPVSASPRSTAAAPPIPQTSTYAITLDDEAPPTPGVRFASPRPTPGQAAVSAIDAALAAPLPADAKAPSQPTAAPAAKPTFSDIPGDVATQIVAGTDKGALSLLGLPGDVQKSWNTIWDRAALGAAHKAFDWTGYGPQAGTPDRADFDKGWDALNDVGPVVAGPQNLPTGADLNKGFEAVAGKLPEPKTVAGEYARTVGEFIPGAGRNVITGALLPGLASEAAGQATKDTGFEPYARVAGGVAGAVGGGALTHALTPVKSYIEPFTTAGQEAIASRNLANETADVPAARAAIDQPSEIVPGSMPTTFQQTGDSGLGQFERKQRMNADTAPAYIERDRAQNAARVDALQGVQSTGSPADVAAQFRQMRDDIDRQAQDQIDRLTPAAQDADAALGGRGTAETTGYALRQPMTDARAAAKQHEDALWDVVNQDAAVPASGLAQTAKQIIGSVSKSAPQLGPEESRILDVAAGYGDTQRFGDLKDLRGSITDATAEARMAGRTQTVRRLTGLRVALDEALDHGVENQAALEDVAVRRGAMAPELAIRSRVKDLIDTHYARQESATVARVAGDRGGNPRAPGDGSRGGADGGRAGRQEERGPGSAASDQGIPPSARSGAQQPEVKGSIAYQAPEFGGRTVSAQMHGPAVSETLGADVPGTVVRPFSGPLGPSTNLPQGIVAYHGTPHEFERFSSQHIGKGEGVQAYGHGLYFAENQGIAKAYQDTLSRDSHYLIDGQPTKDMIEQAAAKYMLANNLSTVPEAKAFAVQKYGEARRALKDFNARVASGESRLDPEGTAELRAKLEETAQSRQSDIGLTKALQDGQKVGYWENAGHLYQVKINRDLDHFLDWSKPLSEQSSYVQRALETPALRALVEAHQDRIAGTGSQSFLGSNIYAAVGGNSRASAAERLKDAGIAGIRYFDAGSRAEGAGTRNYVTFNDHDIQVTHRNGSPLARALSLPDYLKGEARGAFVKELTSAGMSPASFSRDLKIRADRLLQDGKSLDHGTAFAEAAFQRSPSEVQDAILGRATSSRLAEAQGNGGAFGNKRPGAQGLPSAGGGLRRSDQAGGAQGEAARFAPEDLANYRAATAATRSRAETFDEGAAGKVLKPAARGGYEMPDAAVPAAVVPSGKATDPLLIRQFLAAGGTPDALTDATAYSIRAHAMRADGTMDPAKVYSWIRRNGEAIAEMPPEAAAKFRTVADAQSAVDAAVAKRESDLAAFNKTSLAHVANLQHGEDVVKTIGGMFSANNAVERFRTLATAAASEPAARDGLRRAIVEHMMGKLTSNASLNASGISQLKGDTFLGFMRRNGPALRQVFDAPELDMMAAVGNDIDRSLRTHQTKGLTSSPGTAQDIGAAKKGSILGDLAAEIGPAGLAMASHAAGANVLTSGLGFLGAKTIGRMRAAGIATANDLVTKAMLDPALAKKLLAKVPTTPDRGTAQALGDQFVRLSRATALGEYVSATKAERKP